MASDTKAVGRDLTEGPIFSTLVIFALSIILANVIQQLYGMVDLAVAGQFVDSIGTVGVNTGGEMADMMQTDIGAIHNYGYLAYFLGIACSRIIPGLRCFGYFMSGKWKTRELVTKKK